MGSFVRCSSLFFSKTVSWERSLAPKSRNLREKKLVHLYRSMCEGKYIVACNNQDVASSLSQDRRLMFRPTAKYDQTKSLSSPCNRRIFDYKTQLYPLFGCSPQVRVFLQSLPAKKKHLFLYMIPLVHQKMRV